MNLDIYIINSIIIFIFSFVFGIYINKIFEKLYDQYPDIELLLVFLQLFVIILLTYVLYKYKLLNFAFEYYNPHILFSSFLFSLQTQMINTLKKYF